MKNKKLWVKLLLDFVMLITCVLLMRKNNFGMAFHEIAGLAVLAAFLLHILLNIKWVVKVTKKLFSRQIAFHTRLSWILNLLLFVCFAMIGISGACMSKVVFSFRVSGSWQQLHYFFTAVAIIILGVHLGLHASMIGNALKRGARLRSVPVKVIGAVLAVGIFAFGCYSFADTSFTGWLSMPFSSQGGARMGDRSGMSETGESFGGRSKGAASADTEEAAAGTDAETPTDNSESSSAFAAIGGSSDNSDSISSLTGSGSGNGNGSGRTSGGKGMMRGENVQSGGSSVLLSALKYLNVIYLFAAVTAALDFTVKRSKKLRKAKVKPAEVAA